jgi:peptidyl-prolyl cis-trans isomerase C
MVLPPETVVATVDGQKVTAAELQTVLRVLQPVQQQVALKDPRGFLEQFGLMRRLSDLAEKAGLHQKSPIKEQLAYSRMLMMAQAQLQERQNQIGVKPEELQKFYDGNKDLFTQVRLKVIYIPFSANPPAQPAAPENKVLSDAEAKAKAEKVYAQLQAGADFIKLVKENSGDASSASKDGDFGTFRRSDQIPEDIKAAAFALKPGQVTKPLKQPNGYYIFRVEESAVPPFDQVREQVSSNLIRSQMDEWVNAQRKSLDIKIENQAVFPPAQAPTLAPVK